MILLPIVDRELRVAARRPGTYRTRVWAAAGAMLLAGWKCLGFAWQGASMSSQGRSLFDTLSGLAFVYCLCIGARVTADCVSEEKRDGTLGLLFLTDLKGWHVVAGKLAASSLNALYGLLAVLPLLALPLLLGGVTLAQFGQIVVVLLNALIFSLSAGIFVSALSRNERKGIFATLVLVLGVSALPFCAVFFATFVLEWVQEPADLQALMPLVMGNPLYPYLLSLPLPWIPGLVLPPAWTFWLSIAVVQLLSWVLLLVTALLLPQVWKDRPRAPERVDGPRRIERFRAWARGDSGQRQALRARLLARNPFLWLVSRDRFKPAYAWLFVMSMVIMWGWGYWKYQEVMFDFYPLAPTIVLIHCFLKIWVVSEVSHRLVEDQKNGALELLLSTPLTVHDILRGQQLALLRQFGRPMLALCAIELLTFQSNYPWQQLVPVLILLVVDLFTLMCVAMRLSLTARSINEVLLKCVLWVLLLPWLAYVVLWPAWQWTWQHFTFEELEPSFTTRVQFWFVIGLVSDGLLIFGRARPQWLSEWRQKGLMTLAGLSQTIGKDLTRRLKTKA